MIGIGFVMGGIIAAVIVVAMGVVRAVNGSGGSWKTVGMGTMMVLLVVGKFDVDPTAVECPVKEAPGVSQQVPAPRCRVGIAIGRAMAGGGIAIETALRNLAGFSLYSPAGRVNVAAEVKDSVVRLSPVVLGMIMLLAVSLALARPFGAESWFARGAFRREAATLLMGLACLGTMPWAAGLLAAYLGNAFAPAYLFELWLAGMALGGVIGFGVFAKMMGCMTAAPKVVPVGGKII